MTGTNWGRFRSTAAPILAAALAACTTLNGPRTTLSDFGPTPAPYDRTHPKGTKAPLYDLLQDAWRISNESPSDGAKAMAMERAGIAVVKQNCADYFDSAGRSERYLLFGRDVTTFGAAVGTAALAAAHASGGAVAGFALGTTNLIAGNDVLRKQLTYGADFTNSARTMVESNLATVEAAIVAKDPSGYDFLTAVSDLHDFQTICMPPTIIANMNAAIATKRFAAIIVQPAGAPATPAKTPTTTTTTTGAAPEANQQIQARQLAKGLSEFQARNLLPGAKLGSMIQGVSDGLATLAKGQPIQPVETAPAETGVRARNSAPIPAQAKIILRPADD